MRKMVKFYINDTNQMVYNVKTMFNFFRGDSL